jgi:uncharacterized membrane protein
MAHLVVLGFDSREKAEQVFALTGELDKHELLQVEDAAYAWRDADGGVRTQQAFSTTGAGATGGALWGSLLGLLFLSPLLGAAVGAGVGALSGKLTDIGINDDLIRQIAQQLEPGRAAVFMLAQSGTADRVIEEIKPYGPTVVETNLTRDTEEELIRALHS